MNYKKIENNNELIKLEYIETYKFNDGTSKNVIFAPYLNCNATNEQLNSLLSYYKEIFLNKEIGKMKIIDISISEFNNKKILLFDLQCMHCNRIKRVQNIYNNSFSSCQCQRRRHCDWNIIQYLNKYKSFDDFISSEKFKPFERYYIIDTSAPITENNIFKGTYKDYLKVKKVTEDVPLDKDKYRCRNCGMINDKKDDNCSICGAYSKYGKKSIRYLLNSRLYEKEYINDFWDLKLQPLSVSYYDYSDDRKNIYSSMFDFSNEGFGFPKYIFYFLKDNKLNAMGLHHINEVNSKYFLSNYVFYSDSKYIEYQNIYESFDENYKPLFYYEEENENVYPGNKILNDSEMNILHAIYFEKCNYYYNMKVYENDNLVDIIKNIKSVIYKSPAQDGYLLEFLDNSRMFYNYDMNILYKTNDYGIRNKTGYFSYLNYNINLTISDNILKIYQIKNMQKYDNTIIRKIYISKNEKIANYLLFQFLKENYSLVKVNNEFDDDNTKIYSVEIDRNDSKISFIEYMLFKKKASTDRYLIYGYSISLIIRCLFNDYEFKNQVCNLINKDILLINEKNKKQMLIGWIYDFSVNNDNICQRICYELLKKYKTDKLGLLLILLYKYGEENVFDLPSIQYEKIESNNIYIGVKKEYDNEINKRKYNDLLAKIDNVNIVKWKSEFFMYKLIKNYFDDAIFQYRDKKLGLLSFDVFIPSINMAFEYQGLQHFEPVEVFGGKEHFLIQQENDKKKKKICLKNGIVLIEWKYTEKIDKLTLDKKLFPYKNKVKGKYIFSSIITNYN